MEAVLGIPVRLIGQGVDWPAVVQAIASVVSLAIVVMTYESLKISRDTAKAALESAESVKRVERAQISFQLPELVDQEDGFWIIRVFATNFGKTQGNIRRIHVTSINNPNGPILEYGEFLTRGLEGFQVLAASERAKMWEQRLPKMAFGVLAALEYEDVFGKIERTGLVAQFDIEGKYQGGILPAPGWH